MEEKILDKSYTPELVEGAWYKYWSEKGYFHAEIEPGKRPFTIVIPPPNVTGSLHIGHALNNTLQDVVIRKKRMEGIVSLWLPGTDHAGIATQNVVEQQLAKEGLKRQDLGREKFVERVWEWKEQYGNTIIEQLKRLGCSCDWERERFTFDEEYSEAVRTVFVSLYNDGLIYRGKYIINWCPQHQTALSDIEVEYEETKGKLWYVKYFLKDVEEIEEVKDVKEEGYVVVATTRPETMLGDTAVAVHPDDERFKHLVGKTVILPLLNREIPIVADQFVDPEFGTGAVKVTPAHDPNDFEIGQRHGLPQVNIFTEEAILTEEAGPYEGLDRYAGREAVLKDLEKDGYMEKIEEHLHSVGHCYRCHTVVEPYLSEQWFVRMKPLAEPAIESVKDGRIEFVPKRWEKTYFDWMENIRDWCISRQLWWGHRIPVWYCKTCGEAIAATKDPDKCTKCGGTNIKQDEDVLDTWFSSWLWPFATLGWPEQTEDLKFFYPTALLSTAFDIIFFWVARMIMAGLHFAGDVPFNEVYIHALIRDSKGRKMSKSRGNVIDPLEVIEWSGTDALRFTLASLAVPGRDVVLSEDRIEGYRHFVNKIWNASRFIMMNLDDYDPAFSPATEDFTLADRWILSRVQTVVNEVSDEFDTYRFSEACRLLYSFFWSEFCDWYIEWSKNRLKEKGNARKTTQYVLLKVLDTSLKLMHPVMPFVTEEIWQKLPGTGESIMISDWPEADASLIDETAVKQAEVLIDVTNAIRQTKHELGIPHTKKVEVVLVTTDDKKAEILTDNTANLKNLARLDELSIGKERTGVERSAKAVAAGIEIFMPLGDLIDIEKETERLKSEIKEIDEKLKKSLAKLDNKGFIEKAAAEVVTKERDKAAELTDKKAKLESQLGLFL